MAETQPCLFDGPNSTSDLSFVSSDGVTFFVHKVILAYAFQFFKDMFTPPQANLDSSILMAEDSKAIDKIVIPSVSLPLTV